MWRPKRNKQEMHILQDQQLKPNYTRKKGGNHRWPRVVTRGYTPTLWLWNLTPPPRKIKKCNFYLIRGPKMVSRLGKMALFQNLQLRHRSGPEATFGGNHRRPRAKEGGIPPTPVFCPYPISSTPPEGKKSASPGKNGSFRPESGHLGLVTLKIDKMLSNTQNWPLLLKNG